MSVYTILTLLYAFAFLFMPPATRINWKWMEVYINEVFNISYIKNLDFISRKLFCDFFFINIWFSAGQLYAFRLPITVAKLLPNISSLVRLNCTLGPKHYSCVHQRNVLSRLNDPILLDHAKLPVMSRSLSPEF